MSAFTNLLTARASSRSLALKCLNWQSLHEFSLNTVSTCAVQVSPVRARYQHPGDDGINAHIPAYGTRIEQELMVCHFFFFIAVVVMYWEARNAHSSTEAYISRVIYNKPYCRCVVRFKLNRVLARAEPCVENRTVRFFFLWTVPPLIYIYIYIYIYIVLHLRKEVPYKVIILIRDLDMEEFENPWIEETIIYVLDCMQVETKNVLH